jgi:DNA-binding response OmpR family regulator
MDTPLNIIVVEDHDALREVTVEALRGMGHTVTGVDCAEKLDDECAGLTPDLLVIDLNLPGEDGISLARRIRNAQPEAGIIMVTARSQLADKLTGYESGADLYLTKPTSPEELGAAVQALARRIKASPQAQSSFRLNLPARTLHGPQGNASLSAHEATMLAAFARAPAGSLESWQLLELSGKQGEEFTKRTLEVQIVRLRKKLAQTGLDKHALKSIRRWGYQLCVKVTLES